MKARLTFLLITLLFMIQGGLPLYAQVTVGSGDPPEKGALLEFKEKNATNRDADDVLSFENSVRGVLFPKVSLKAWNKLTPLYGGIDNGGGEWTDLSSADEKLSATGMIVYNVNTDAVDLEEGLYMWRISEWVKVSGGTGQAQFEPVSCTNIVVNGTYVEKKPVTSENFLTITLNVKKIGTFAISATTGNGYSFYFSGVALDLGPLTINIQSQGKPIAVQTDKLLFEGLELTTGCEPKIEVKTAIAAYSINCATVNITGQYLKGVALTNQTITMSVNATAAGSYVISTPVVNGISFKGEGTFAGAGTHPVTLVGTGTPTVNLSFPIEIHANTIEGNNTCSAVVPVTLPGMTYAIIGHDNYSWATNGRRDALTNGGISFGPTGIVRIKEFKELWNTREVDDAANWLNNGYGGKNAKPDIVLYFSYGASANTKIRDALITYINKGGCVIFGSRDEKYEDVNIIMKGIFNLSTDYAVRQTQNGPTDDDIYQINNLPDDPIINGPFGNLAGMYWGEDNATTGSIIVTQLPINSIQICSALSDAKADNGAKPERQNYSIVWYNESKNFVYFGDSTGATTTSDSRNDYPARYTSSGMPLAKVYQPYPSSYSSYKKTVYNSALELNCVAWAIKKAAIAGINPH